MKRSTYGAPVRAGAVGVVTLLLAGVLGACGSSGNSSKAGASSATSGASSSASKAPTGSPIKIGMIASQTGAQASSTLQAFTVAPAWADYVNKDLGGINGHPVEVITKDDRGDPVQAQSVAASLVSAGVVAVVAGSDNETAAYDKTVIKAGVPMVGANTPSTEWVKNAGMFPIDTDSTSISKGNAYVAKNFGHGTVYGDVYCSELAACGFAASVLKPASEKLGMGFVPLAVSSSASSYTAQCVALQQKKVDVIFLGFSSAPAAKLVRDCQAQGYNPVYEGTTQVLGPQLLIPGAVMYGTARAFPWQADDPAVKKFVDAMTKYAKSDNWKEGTGTPTWTALEAVRKALSSVSESATVTAKDVMDGLNSFKDENIDGLSPNKVTFTAGQPAAAGSQPCFFVVQIKDQKITAPQGLTPVCPTGL